MKAMSCGAFPITSRYTHSVLPELTKGFDFGPPVALNLTTASNEHAFEQWLKEEYVPAVSTAVKWALTNPEEWRKMRENMKARARKIYSWRHAARVLVDAID